MAKTIIQTIGPLYGEVVNGTVYGQPNGSIYIPSTNTITLTGTSKIKNFVVGGAYRVRFVDDGGLAQNAIIVAQSQDIASNIRLVLATDSDLDTIVATRDFAAGQFNLVQANLFNDYQLTSETTYYVGALLVNNNTPVATDSVEVVAE